MATVVYHIPNPPYDPQRHGPPTVVYGGLMRMGSLSVAHAFAILGIRTHHALEAGWDDWVVLESLANATWPKPGAARSKHIINENLERLFSKYDCVTDIASYWAPEVLELFGPGIKVVLVQRDFENWWASMSNEVIQYNLGLGLMPRAFITLCEKLTGIPAGTAMRAILLGWLNTTDHDPDLKMKARRRYDEHYAYIRKSVPPELLLEYKLGDGWEPLCKFLGKEVPNIPFPRVNDSADHWRRGMERLQKLGSYFFRRCGPGIVAASAVGIYFMTGRSLGGSV